MSTTPPAKRRATTTDRSNMLDQPMRQTRSMARISDFNDFSELSSTSRVVEQRQTTVSSTSSDTRDPPPARRKRIARQSTTWPDADVGLPRSKTSVAHNSISTTSGKILLTSHKGNSPTAPSDPDRAGASPVKPVVPLPHASRLHGPTPSMRSSSQTAAAPSSDAAKLAIPSRTKSSKPPDVAKPESKPLTSSRDPTHGLLFGTSDIKSDASDVSSRRNPFLDASTDTNSLAMLGEPRHSPVKRFQPKNEFIISSPERPDRKPINLLELKPSPGKARRGIFRHDRVDDYEDDEDREDREEDDDGSDEIRLIKWPPLKKVQTTSSSKTQSSSSAASCSSTSSKNPSIPPSAASTDVKHTLSAETSDALASLEATLAKFKGKTRSPPATTRTASDKNKHAEPSTHPSVKRELGTARSSGMTSSRTHIFRNKPTLSSSDSSFSARSTTADQSSDSSVFKRPSGRVSALAKSRGASSDLASSLTSSLASSKSLLSFGAPQLPRISQLDGRPSVGRTIVTGSRTSSLDMPSNSRAEEEAAQREEEERVAQAKRQAEVKAGKRKSIASIPGMPEPLLHRKDAEAAGKATTTASSSRSSSYSYSSSSSTPAPTATRSSTAEPPTEAERAEARRLSLYTYAYIPITPVTRVDDADRSVGNVSAGIVVSSGSVAGNDAEPASAQTQSFLRGLTVLVDVRDLDGEDASVCWGDMLKNAGAKVMVRFGERRLTHIVYKSGRPSTLRSYWALEEPKPYVVSIRWIAACLEQGARVDETPYLVDMAKEAIFAKPRRSLTARKRAPASANIAIRERE